jgi:ADP-ribose pyrophosphatase
MNDAMKTRVEWLKDESPEPPPGAWLRHRRPRMRAVYADGTSSEPFTYEHVERRATDAVVLLMHFDGQVLLRTSLRPPLAIRTQLVVPLPGEETDSPMLWEVPAGLIEPEEQGHAGIRACAVREALEETGVVLAQELLMPLGAPSFLCPGVIAEQLHYFAAELSSATIVTALGDGSPVEERAALAFFPFAEALALTRDVKTELGIRRLMAQLGVVG